MIVPYAVDVPFDRRPWANWVLMAITVTISITAWLSPSLTEALALGRYDVPDVLSGLPTGFHNLTDHPVRFESHAYVTYAFVHAGLVHLAGNMLFLFVFGNAVNYKLGHIGYVAAYLALVAISGYVHVILRGVPVVGASGGICGLLGLIIVFFPANRVHCVYCVFYRLHEHVGWFEVSSIWIICLWIATDALTMWFDLADDVAVEAHLAGTVVGIVVGLLLAMLRIVRPTESERTLLDLLRRGR